VYVLPVHQYEKGNEHPAPPAEPPFVVAQDVGRTEYVTLEPALFTDAVSFMRRPAVSVQV
jgi:hypothetical protein